MSSSLFVRRLMRVLLGLFLGAVVVAAYTLYLVRTQGEVAMQPPVIETTQAAPAFDLVDQHGQRFTDEDLKGKVWVADFIFTNCPDFCPALTANMVRLQRELAADGLLGEDVMLVSFSVDPIADTPEVLYRYTEAYGADQDSVAIFRPGRSNTWTKCWWMDFSSRSLTFTMTSTATTANTTYTPIITTCRRRTISCTPTDSSWWTDTATCRVPRPQQLDLEAIMHDIGFLVNAASTWTPPASTGRGRASTRTER